jgi:hypothetical protein
VSFVVILGYSCFSIPAIFGNAGNFGNSVCGYFFFFLVFDEASGCAPVTLAST